mgnify:CR=1 FL=1
MLDYSDIGKWLLLDFMYLLCSVLSLRGEIKGRCFVTSVSEWNRTGTVFPCEKGDRLRIIYRSAIRKTDGV